MVEQRPFKALVLGSSPSQPTPLFPLRVVFIGEMGSSRRVSSNAAKRRNAHKSAVNAQRFSRYQDCPRANRLRCGKTFSVMSPFARRAVLRGPPWLERLRHRPGRWRLYRLRQALYRLDTPRPTLVACPGEDGASGVPMLRAISRSRMPEAKAVLAAPTFQRIFGNACAIEHKELRERFKPQASRRSHEYLGPFPPRVDRSGNAGNRFRVGKSFSNFSNFASRFP